MNWRSQAACLDADPELFAEQNSHSTADWTQLQRTADTYCRFCPSLLECRAEGDANQERGIWGGRYRRERHGKVKMRTLVVVDTRKPRMPARAAS